MSFNDTKITPSLHNLGVSPSMPTTPTSNPFSKISIKLLRAVFGHICSNGPIYLPLQSSDARHTLSLVCKRWFDTVRSTYSFWTNIHFTRPPPPPRTNPNLRPPFLRQFAFCIGNTGQDPLDITFDMISNGWEFSIVRSVIIPYVARIKTLSCPIYGNPNIFEFLTIPEGSFSILESIELWLINTRETPASSFPPHISLQFCAFRTTPRLCKAIMYLSNGLHPIDLCFPWGQLTTLDMGSASMAPSVFMEIMYHAAQRLEDAFFKVRFDQQVDHRLVLWLRSVKMRALKILRLRLLFPTQDTRLFSLLQLPSVEILRLEVHDQFQDWHNQVPLYIQLLQESTKCLRQLHLIDYPCPGDADKSNSGLVVRRRHPGETNPDILNEFFAVIENVQNLHLPVGFDINAATVEQISMCTLLPQLNVLELGTVDPRLILSMAKRRHARWLHASLAEPDFEAGHPRWHIAPLRSVSMLIPHHSYGTEEKAALMEEAHAFRVLDIKFYIHTTLILPLPKLMSIGLFT